MKESAARNRLQEEGQFLLPEEVDDELLARLFSLSDDDKEQIGKCRGDENRLGFALTLCFFRITFRFPSSYEVIPLRAVNELARQLGIPQVKALAYPGSDETRWDHERRIREYLGVRPFDEDAEKELSGWIMDLALEGELPENLRERAEAHLRKANVLLPGSTVFDRVIQRALAQADEACLRRVVERIDPSYHDGLLDLLRERRGRGQPGLTKLKKLNVRASPAAVKDLAATIVSLRQRGGDAIDLSGIPPTLVGRLARIVDERTPSYFRRMRRDRALAFLACFVTETFTRAIDLLFDVDHRIVTGLRQDAQDDYGEWLKQRALRTDEDGGFLASVVRAPACRPPRRCNVGSPAPGAPVGAVRPGALHLGRRAAEPSLGARRADPLLRTLSEVDAEDPRHRDLRRHGGRTARARRPPGPQGHERNESQGAARRRATGLGDTSLAAKGRGGAGEGRTQARPPRVGDGALDGGSPGRAGGHRLRPREPPLSAACGARLRRRGLEGPAHGSLREARARRRSARVHRQAQGPLPRDRPRGGYGFRTTASHASRMAGSASRRIAPR